MENAEVVKRVQPRGFAVLCSLMVVRSVLGIAWSLWEVGRYSPLGLVDTAFCVWYASLWLRLRSGGAQAWARMHWLWAIRLGFAALVVTAILLHAAAHSIDWNLAVAAVLLLVVELAVPLVESIVLWLYFGSSAVRAYCLGTQADVPTRVLMAEVMWGESGRRKMIAGTAICVAYAAGLALTLPRLTCFYTDLGVKELPAGVLLLKAIGMAAPRFEWLSFAIVLGAFVGLFLMRQMLPREARWARRLGLAFDVLSCLAIALSVVALALPYIAVAGSLSGAGGE